MNQRLINSVLYQLALSLHLHTPIKLLRLQKQPLGSDTFMSAIRNIIHASQSLKFTLEYLPTLLKLAILWLNFNNLCFGFGFLQRQQ